MRKLATSSIVMFPLFAFLETIPAASAYRMFTKRKVVGIQDWSIRVLDV